MHGVTPVNTMSLQEKLFSQVGLQEFRCRSYIYTFSVSLHMAHAEGVKVLYFKCPIMEIYNLSLKCRLTRGLGMRTFQLIVV